MRFLTTTHRTYNDHKLKHGKYGEMSMFLDVNELQVRKIRIRKSYSPGTLDFHSGEFRQVEPLGSSCHCGTGG